VQAHHTKQSSDMTASTSYQAIQRHDCIANTRSVALSVEQSLRRAFISFLRLLSFVGMLRTLFWAVKIKLKRNILRAKGGIKFVFTSADSGFAAEAACQPEHVACSFQLQPSKLRFTMPTAVDLMMPASVARYLNLQSRRPEMARHAVRCCHGDDDFPRVLSPHGCGCV
jgi:hypothetical protein